MRPTLLAGSILLLSRMHLAYADWIDPDTPYEARTTQPLRVIPPPPPPPYYWVDPNKQSFRIQWGPPVSASPTHSAAPSTSSAPSQSPSVEPSSFPSHEPGTYHLVFSDEFNTPDRSFADGEDPRWTALEKNDYTNDALHYYSAKNVQTNDEGHMVITSQAQDTDIIGFDDVEAKRTHVTKHFRSAMVQSWNKFCFTGGIVEAEVILPGKHNVGGLWPAFWILGNLARHTYVGSSEHVWPWSSTVCTPKSADSQHFTACDQVTHYGFKKHVGRGAPEVDIFEVQPGNVKANTGPYLESSVGQPFASASFQVAPGRPENRPGNGYWPGPGQWYEGLTGGWNSTLNINFYGNYNHFVHDTNPSKSDYWSDAISYNRQLDKSFFEKPHVFRLEWDVPTAEKDGYLHWFVDEKLVLAINGTGVVDAGLGSSITSEPSYLLMNTAISKQWGFPLHCPTNCDCKKYDCNSKDWQLRCGFSEGFCDMMKAKDPEYKINWVRVYQNPDMEEQKVGCSTPERPTRRFIEAHPDMYKTEFDKTPLKDIKRGQGHCDPRASTDNVTRTSCGGIERGRCTQGRVCECRTGWTGPHCLVHQGYDDILYDEPSKITDVGFIPPSVAPRFLAVGLAVLALVMFFNMRCRRRLAGWTPIPDVEINNKN